MPDICNDNRFELINKYKQKLIDGTNIETAPDEMAVINNILFRFWQMGWLDKLEQPEQQWIPIKWHDCTDEDREKYGFSNDIVAVFDCEMPDDDQPILVTTSHGYVNQDVCYIDDGYSLDSGWDWIDDIKAWMPLPEPYKGDES